MELAAEELSRADHFVFDDDRMRFISHRWFLRFTLSRYTGLSPRELAFGTSPNGKPHLLNAVDAPAFNLTHAGAFCAIAVTRPGPVGIDAEAVSTEVNVADLSHHVLSAAELQHLAAAPKQDREQLFFDYWVCKEASLKYCSASAAEIRGFEINGLSRQAASFVPTLKGRCLGHGMKLSLPHPHVGALVTPYIPKQVSYFDRPLSLATPAT